MPPVTRDQVFPMLLRGGTNRLPATAPPRFRIGDKVVTSRANPPTHTRVPNYARGRVGTVTACHGGFAFMDAQARGRNDVADHLYTVRFEAAELWGESAGGRDAIYLDMHESYLRSAQ
jgi:nitrile hydratase subunit beta